MFLIYCTSIFTPQLTETLSREIISRFSRDLIYECIAPEITFKITVLGERVDEGLTIFNREKLENS